MPKPQGTYLKIQAGQKAAANARDAKQTVANAKADREARFFQALDKTPQSKLMTWQRAMGGLASAIKKNELLSKEDKVRKAVAEVIGQVRKVLEQAKSLKDLDASLQQPATAVIRAPRDLGPAGAELVLVIALVKVLEVLVRLRGRRSMH